MEFISIKYSIPYLLFLSFLFFLLFYENRLKNKGINNQAVRWLMLICFVLFYGFRGYIGRDFPFYVDLFNGMPTLWRWDTAAFSAFNCEFGYKFYVVFLKSIWSNYFFFIFISILIDAFILNEVIKRHSKYYVLAFVIFLVFQGHIYEIDQLRNCKSVMLFLLSLKYLQEEKVGKYMLLNLIGITFHLSSILYLPAYFFLKKRFSKNFYIVILIVGILMILLKIEYIKPSFLFIGNLLGDPIQTKVVDYLNNTFYNYSYGLTLGFIERIISFILICFVFYEKILKQNEKNLIFINLYVLFYISFFVLQELMIAVTRISPLFAFSYAILLPSILYEIKGKLNKSIFLTVLCLYMFLKFISYNKFIEYKYNNILFKKESLIERRKINDQLN